MRRAMTMPESLPVTYLFVPANRPERYARQLQPAPTPTP
jgi:hypothetical protein